MVVHDYFFIFRYRVAAKQKSIILRDRPSKPIDDAIFWVEYVIRHKGAKHLRVPYWDMPLYQVYMIDVIGVIFAITVIVILIFILIILKLYNYILKRSGQKKRCHKDTGKKNK